MRCHMLGIWHSAWYAEGTQQMVSDHVGDDDSIVSPYPCRGVTNGPLLFFLAASRAIYMLILFLLGGGSEKKKDNSPKVLCRQTAESRVGFPKVSGPPGFPSLPLGPPCLWLPGTVWQG